MVEAARAGCQWRWKWTLGGHGRRYPTRFRVLQGFPTPDPLARPCRKPRPRRERRGLARPGPARSRHRSGRLNRGWVPRLPPPRIDLRPHWVRSSQIGDQRRGVRSSRLGNPRRWARLGPSGAGLRRRRCRDWRSPPVRPDRGPPGRPVGQADGGVRDPRRTGPGPRRCRVRSSNSGDPRRSVRTSHSGDRSRWVRSSNSGDSSRWVRSSRLGNRRWRARPGRSGVGL